MIWLIALICIGLSATGQLLLKIAMTAIRGAAEASPGSLLLAVATSPHVIAGFGAYGISAVLWLHVLSKLDLSVAYPLNSLGFVAVAILSWLVLGESLSITRLGGIALIVAGVAVMGSSST